MDTSIIVICIVVLVGIVAIGTVRSSLLTLGCSLFPFSGLILATWNTLWMPLYNIIYSYAPLQFVAVLGVGISIGLAWIITMILASIVLTLPWVVLSFFEYRCQLPLPYGRGLKKARVDKGA